VTLRDCSSLTRSWTSVDFPLPGAPAMPIQYCLVVELEVEAFAASLPSRISSASFAMRDLSMLAGGRERSRGGGGGGGDTSG